MKLTEKQLKGIIAEGVKKALSGTINMPEYTIGKSIKRITELLDSEAEKFLGEYNDTGDQMYDAYSSKLYAISEKLEKFIKEFKENKGF